MQTAFSAISASRQVPVSSHTWLPSRPGLAGHLERHKQPGSGLGFSAGVSGVAGESGRAGAAPRNSEAPFASRGIWEGSIERRRMALQRSPSMPSVIERWTN